MVSLKARKSGPFLFIEAVLGVNGNMSASAAHRVAELSRRALLDKHPGRVANAIVHIDPLGASGMVRIYSCESLKTWVLSLSCRVS